MNKIIILFLAVSLLGGITPIFAQEGEQKTPTIEGLQEKIKGLEEKQAKEIWDLREQIEAIEEQAGVAQEAPQAQAVQRLNIFNPRITVFGNFVGRLDDKKVITEDGDSIDNRFNLREVELDFRAAIDPWADGVVIATFESDVPNEFETQIEEGYITLKKLPGLDSAPWGLKLKAGRFRPEFGRFNKIHTHDLPQVTRPLSLKTFLGEEGFIQNGLSARFFIPTPGEHNTLEPSLEVLNGGGLPVAEENIGEDIAFLGHLKWFWDLFPGHDLEIGASGYFGKFDAAGDLESRLYGMDFNYKWKPFRQGEWRSFLFGGEFFLADIEVAGGGDKTPFGFYLWSQYQYNSNLYLGVRYDFTEAVENEEVETRGFGTYLTYYTTEFLRFRLGYEHTMSDFPDIDGRDTFLLEINFVFGSHPVEPYWVNR